MATNLDPFAAELGDVMLPPTNPDDQNPVWDFTVDLGNREFRIVLRYNSRMDGWYFDIYYIDGEAVILGKRLSVEDIPGQLYKPLSQDPRWKFATEVDTSDSESAEFAARILTLMDVGATGREAQYEDLGRSHRLYYTTVGALLVNMSRIGAFPEGFSFETTKAVSYELL